MLLLASPPNRGDTPERRTTNVAETSVSPELRAAVQESQRQSWTYTEIRYLDDRTTAGLAIGAPLSVPGVGPYELYYLFPLTQEEATIDLVRRTVLAVGLLLVLTLGGIAYVVTRQVVSPVRLAARTAEKFSAGHLTERMRVRGEDDLALLARSFNEMAGNLQEQITRLESLSRVQQRFVSDVSHELRTPLTTVRMAADVLYESRDEFDPATARSAELLQTQLDRFEALLADLLEISRFDAGAAVLDADTGRPPGARRALRRGRGTAGRAQGHAGARRAAVHRHARRGRRPSCRPRPAQPRGQRDRARRRPAGRGHRRAQRDGGGA